MKSRTLIIYTGLVLGWFLIAGWQSVEHQKVVDDAEDALVNRGRDITGSISRTLRALAYRVPFNTNSLQVPPIAVKVALDENVNWRGVISLELLNTNGEAIARSGEVIADTKRVFATNGVPPLWDWAKSNVTIAYVVSLQARGAQGETSEQPLVVQPQRSPGPPPGASNGAARGEPANGILAPGSGRGERGERGNGPGANDGRGGRDPGPPRGGRGPPGGVGGFGRPTIYTDEEWKAWSQQNEIHSFLIVMSTDSVLTASLEDYHRRLIILGFAMASAIGLGLAWMFSSRSGDLQMRLVRASESNTHLREMNLAAAGLAHETRNPLNIIRGLAQMISKSSEGDVRIKSREITEEVDRVSAQLNEFINYSKPRDVRRAPVQLGTVISDVLRALKSDIEDQRIALHRTGEELPVEADQGMLRQVLFNLLINAIHFVGPGGEIQIITTKASPTDAAFEVRDNGPGVPAENRTSIFQPYFTTRTSGTGLGLAVVKQIADAHGWEIQCLPNGDRGTIFRVSGLALTDARAREKRSS